MQSMAILFLHLAAYSFLWMILVAFGNATVVEAMVEASLDSTCYLSSLFTSIVVYRLFFHRLRAFPGPVLAQSSKLWHAWQGRHSKNHLLLDQLYHHYGDFVRTGKLCILALGLCSRSPYTGPSELTIFDASAFLAVNGAGTKCTKSVWYDFMQPHDSIISTRSRQQHSKRRRVWSPAFSVGGEFSAYKVKQY